MADTPSSEAKDNSEEKDNDRATNSSEEKNVDGDEESTGRKKKESRNKKSFSIPAGVGVNEKHVTKNKGTSSGPYNQFRANLGSLQEALVNRQYDLGRDEIRKEDIEMNHIEHDTHLHMRRNWHDGTAGSEHDELLHDMDSPALHVEQGVKRGTNHSRNPLSRQQRRARQHYVESATGFFKRVQATKSHKHHRTDNSSEDVYTKYYRAKAALDPRERTMWLFAQGLLAGFSSAPVLLQWSTASDQNFISSYRRISNSMRRILFLLCMIAAAGAIDQLKHALLPSKSEKGKVKKWKERGREERVLLWFSALVYLCALSATLLCSITDAVISQRDYYDYASKSTKALTTGWEDYALNYDESGNFKDLLDQWESSNNVRFFCALAGWLIVVRLHFLKLIDNSTADAVETLTQKLSSQVDLCRKLRSDIPVLEHMSFDEIHRLHEEQQRAADITHLILSQEHHLTNANVSLV